ncbi:MAG: alpha/beta hydrolase [Oscillospiraceae bacterium]|nr:alpha/beta hydrolase [Oscillospiraceae bacterium]
MATFLFENRPLYYEEHGVGRPLIVLNGIFMSCASWAAFAPGFSQHCRLILLDLLDQGRSAKMDGEYTQALQVRAVAALMDHLQLDQADLMGISYGGEVALQLAVTHPQRIRRLVLSNTAAYTSDWLRDIGHAWEYAFASRDGHQFFKTCIPIVYSPQFYEANYAWASAREELFVRAFSPEVYDAFARLTRSAETHDVRSKLGAITAPTLVISSEMDYVTPPYQQAELAARIPNASHLRIEGAGHAVMYEKPIAFASVVLGFLMADTDIQVL